MIARHGSLDGHDLTGVLTCERRSRFRARLDDPKLDEEVNSVRLGGRYVAYEITGEDNGAFYDNLQVTKTTDGKTEGVEAGDCRSCTYFLSYVVADNGSVAYVLGPDKPYEVAKCEWKTCLTVRGSLGTRLDRGRGIAPASLQLRGSRLSWRNRGRLHTGHLG